MTASLEQLFARPLKTAFSLRPTAEGTGPAAGQVGSGTTTERPTLPQGVWRHPSMMSRVEQQSSAVAEKPKLPQGVRRHPSMLQQVIVLWILVLSRVLTGFERSGASSFVYTVGG